MNPTAPSLVIFDLDGTVVDSLPATYRCFRAAVEPALGHAVSDADITARMGAADFRIIAEWVGPAHAEAAVARLYDGYAREFHAVEPFAGMVELIEELRAAGRRTALFTGRGRPSTDIMLRAMDLERLFDVTVTGEEVAHPKPAPDGLLEVLTLLTAPPETSVYVADAMIDVRAATAAGVPLIAALWGSRECAELAAVDGLVAAESVVDLRALLL